jgi:hypothetical protein
MYAMWLTLPVLANNLRPGNVGDDCPVFDGLFEFCSISAGGSMGMVAPNQARGSISWLNIIPPQRVPLD